MIQPVLALPAIGRERESGWADRTWYRLLNQFRWRDVLSGNRKTRAARLPCTLSDAVHVVAQSWEMCILLFGFSSIRSDWRALKLNSKCKHGYCFIFCYVLFDEKFNYFLFV